MKGKKKGREGGDETREMAWKEQELRKCIRRASKSRGCKQRLRRPEAKEDI